VNFLNSLGRGPGSFQLGDRQVLSLAGRMCTSATVNKTETVHKFNVTHPKFGSNWIYFRGFGGSGGGACLFKKPTEWR
jgi:hypothetical protein